MFKDLCQEGEKIVLASELKCDGSFVIRDEETSGHVPDLVTLAQE